MNNVYKIFGREENVVLPAFFFLSQQYISNSNLFCVVKKLGLCSNGLTLSQKTNFRRFKTERGLQTTISYLMKMAGSSSNG